MLAEERRERILEMLGQQGRVIAADLAQRFATSEDTIRRDLRDLDLAGKLRRVHGGAVRRTGMGPDFRERVATDPVRKRALALAAAALIRPEDILLIDAGSTNLALARLLEDGQATAIITNCPHIAVATGHFSRTEVIMLGGTVAAGTGSVRGARTLRALADIRADLCFIGACGLDPAFGLGVWESEDAVLKQAMIYASHRTACAVTTEKLTQTAPFKVADLAGLHHIILEADAPADLVTRLRAGAEVPDVRIAAPEAGQ